jgi:hydroxymethylpyrimidine pyrophosphatase-like HAD family hydrolase
MRFAALATDYDGTLAHHGVANAMTMAAIKRLRESGRKALLVTGRRLDDLFDTFDEAGAFDLIVAENGALLFNPATREEQTIAEPPPDSFWEALKRGGVRPLDRGRVILATLEDQKDRVLETIAQQNLELQMIFNKGALMILPAGVNKASGLDAALDRLCLSRHNVAGIGDAENDHAFLSACECAVAVANALPALKERSDIVTKGAHGDGVVELIGQMIGDDLAGHAEAFGRHSILLGSADDGSELKLPAYGMNVLLAGSSGAGKSSLTTGILERMIDAGYQLCVIDPEGDYQNLPKSVVLGDAKTEPPIDQVLQALNLPQATVVANLVGVPLDRRVDYFDRLLPGLADLQSKLGRPHRIALDEVHHLVPADRRGAPLPDVDGLIAATLDPASVWSGLLKRMDAVIAVGESTGKTIRSFAEIAGAAFDGDIPGSLEKGEAVMWRRKSNEAVHFSVAPCHTPRTRHSRKYAEAMLTPDRSFYFRGPDNKLNLRASNLITFVQMMEGVDDETFAFHLQRGDYSNWFRDNIKNAELAEEAGRIEAAGLEPGEGKEQMKRLIEERYTLPA